MTYGDLIADRSDDTSLMNVLARHVSGIASGVFTVTLLLTTPPLASEPEATQTYEPQLEGLKFEEALKRCVDLGARGRCLREAGAIARKGIAYQAATWRVTPMACVGTAGEGECTRERIQGYNYQWIRLENEPLVIPLSDEFLRKREDFLGQVHHKLVVPLSAGELPDSAEFDELRRETAELLSNEHGGYNLISQGGMNMAGRIHVHAN